jgi:prevent-host-death family protein
MTVAQARAGFADALNRATYSHERTIITRHEEDVAAIISVDELRLLDALIERYEDEADVADARTALLEAREDRAAWGDIKREFGL